MRRSSPMMHCGDCLFRREARGVPPARRLLRIRGFTLVELLAALGISLLLIAAVSASLDIYVRVTSAGQVAIERQQVTRALLDQMTRDVSSVVFYPADASESGEENGETDSEDTETTIVVENSESTDETASLGLLGDSSSLRLNISRPTRGLNYSAPQTATSLSARTSDLLVVTYFLADPGADGLAGAVANQHFAAITDPTERATASRGPAGLARLEGDRMAMDHADVEQDDAALAGASQVIAPEIARLQFRYFDGEQWVETWDSVEMDRLPQAIEVTLGFRDAQAEANAPSGLSSVIPIGQTVRHVIQVPLSLPAAALNEL